MKNHSAENITGSISFEKKIIGYFLLVLLIIVSIIFIYKKISDDYKVSREWVTHTEHILTLSDSILANEKDIIIETRGYIITGNPNSLVSYKQNNLSFDTNLLKLKSLVKDNPLQEKRLDSVQSYYKKYTIIREHAIAIRNKKDFQLADEIPLIDAADKVLTDLHNIFNSIQADEKRLLVKRKEDFKQRTAASALVIRILLLVFIISLLLAFVIVYRNIVKRNKAENRVRQLNDELEKRVEENTKQAIQKEKQYRFLIENMREGIQVIGFDWRYLFVNNSVVRQGKYSNEELLGHTMMEKYPGIENTELFSVLSKCMTMRSPQILENEFTYPDNTTGWFELSIQPVPEGLFILSMDISKRKKAENTLVHSEEKRRLIMNAAIDAIICMDINGVITFWNPQAEKTFGWTKEEVVGHLLSDFIIPHEFREMHNKGLQHYLKTGQGTALNKFLEVEALNRQGKKFPVEMTILPIDQQNEKFFCAFIRDISERKRSEILMKQLNERLEKRAEELQSSNTELEHFAYVASHDLQEPLRMVTSFMALLKKKLNNHLDESAASYMHFAVDGAERMKTLIQDLLKYSRLGNTAEGSTSFEIKEVITNVLQVYSPAIRENEAIVHLGEFPLISGNKTQINQLFQNLVGNALKYRNTKPPVLEIGCTEKKEEWLFFIKDNGIGIDPKFFDKIFVIFQRLHNKNEFSGTGIGLAICKKIVERHGGKLWVESSLGHGSTFYFTLKKPQHV